MLHLHSVWLVPSVQFSQALRSLHDEKRRQPSWRERLSLPKCVNAVQSASSSQSALHSSIDVIPKKVWIKLSGRISHSCWSTKQSIWGLAVALEMRRSSARSILLLSLRENVLLRLSVEMHLTQKIVFGVKPASVFLKIKGHLKNFE